MARNSVAYEVRPFYSGGSPAQVDERTAFRVAAQERDAYKMTLEGFYGEDAVRLAKSRGLRGIVFSWSCKYKGKREEFNVEDVLTGETFLGMKSLPPRDEMPRPFLPVTFPEPEEVKPGDYVEVLYGKYKGQFGILRKMVESFGTYAHVIGVGTAATAGVLVPPYFLRSIYK